MTILFKGSNVWNEIGAKVVSFYDNCTQTAYTDDCPTVHCGCVVKTC